MKKAKVPANLPEPHQDFESVLLRQGWTLNSNGLDWEKPANHRAQIRVYHATKDSPYEFCKLWHPNGKVSFKDIQNTETLDSILNEYGAAWGKRKEKTPTLEQVHPTQSTQRKAINRWRAVHEAGGDWMVQQDGSEKVHCQGLDRDEAEEVARELNA